MNQKIDIVVTWPKTKPLESYLETLRRAFEAGDRINYRVARRPYWEFGALKERPARCYRVHNGAVRGYTEIIFCTHRYEYEVRVVGSDQYWPAGEYVVCSARWWPLGTPIPMRGFQGWRWFATDT